MAPNGFGLNDNVMTFTAIVLCASSFCHQGVAARRIVIVGFPGVELLDVAGPANVFTAADRLLGGSHGYHVELAAAAAPRSIEVARWLVMYLRRPGGQSQFSGPLAAQRAERESIAALAAWMDNNLEPRRCNTHQI